MRAFATDEQLDTLMAVATETLGFSPQDFELITGAVFTGASSTIAATLGDVYGLAEGEDIAADFPPQVATPRLRAGDTRKLAVKALQHYLNLRGATPALRITGTFDADTENAVKTFQTAAGLVPSGEVDGATWAKIEPGADTPLAPFLSYVPIFLARTGLSYPELVELVQSGYFNPAAFDIDYLSRAGFSLDEISTWMQAGFPPLSAAQEAKLTAAGLTSAEFKDWVDGHRELIVIGTPPGVDCSLDATIIRHLDGSLLLRGELERLHPFVRLWRRLGWPMHLVDLAYSVLFDDPFNFVLRLADMVRVQRALELEPERCLSFWGPIDTRGDKSLYDKLFRNQAALRIEPIFELNAARTELQAIDDDPTNPPKIADHVPALLAAFRIRGADLALLVDDLALGARLDLSNLSQIYRYVLLAKALALSVRDLLTLRRLAARNPFGGGSNPPLDTWRFIALARKVAASGVSIPTLDFLFRHRVAPPAQPEQPTEQTLRYLEALHAGLLKIEAEHRPAPDPKGELVRAEFSLLEDDPHVIDQLVQLVDGTAVYTAALPGLPVNFTVPTPIALKARYERGTGVLRFTGVMTTAERTSLLNAAGSLPMAQQALYQDAVTDLFDAPRTFFDTHLAPLLDDPTTAAAALLDRRSLDGQLRPVMLDAAGNPIAYDATGELPASPAAVDTEIARKFLRLLELLQPHTRRLLKEALIVQSASEAFGLQAPVAAALLKNPVVLGSLRKPGAAAVADFVETTGDGLTAAYFGGAALDGEATVLRTDAGVDFDWSAAVPDPALPSFPFGVRWTGLLLVPSNEEHTFRVDAGDGVRLWVGGKLIIDDWSDQPLTPREGKVRFAAAGFQTLRLEYARRTVATPVRLRWSSASQPLAPLPVERLYTVRSATRLAKAAQLALTLPLDARELEYFSRVKRLELGRLPLNADAAFDPVPFSQWLELLDFRALRARLPQGETTLIDAFESPSPAEARRRLRQVAGWRADELERLTGPDLLAFSAPHFADAARLLRLAECLRLLRQLGINPDQAREWTRIRREDTSTMPATVVRAFTLDDAERAGNLAQEARRIARAKHDDASWLEVARPLSDRLREARKAALIGYILAMPSIIERGIVDTGKLFEFFLVDVETCACSETSRIKQAISSVQLFVHRCLMGLEDHGPAIPYTVHPSQIDAVRWRWMPRYVIWEANRKVFLYPENWLEPDLRDDRSPFFRELESELLQNDLTEPYVEKALLHYLEKLDDIARLEMCGVREDLGSSTLHIFGRTRNSPHQYFHRRLVSKRGGWENGVWTAWEKLPLDIAGVEDGPRGELSGVHLMPALWNRRLYLFWPLFRRKADQDATRALPQGFEPIEQWEIKLAWSEYFDGKWSVREQSEATMLSEPDVVQTSGAADEYEHYAPVESTIITTVTSYFMGIKTDEYSYPLPSLIPKLIEDGVLKGVLLDKFGDFAEAHVKHQIVDVTQLLPPPANHMFTLQIGGGEVVIDGYQRYDGQAVGKRSEKSTLTTTIVQDGARDDNQRTLIDKETNSYRTARGYRRIGRFVIDSCRSKVRSVPTYQDFAYESLLRPSLAGNFFQWMQASPSAASFEFDGAATVLRKLPSPYEVIDSDARRDFNDWSPFFYQDHERVYLVLASTAPPGAYDYGKLIPAKPEIPSYLAPKSQFDPQKDLARPYVLAESARQRFANAWLTPAKAAPALTPAGALPGGLAAAAPAGSGFVDPASEFIPAAGLERFTIEPISAMLGRARYRFLNHWHPHVCEFIRRLNKDGIDALLDTSTQRLSNDTYLLPFGEIPRFQAEYSPTDAVSLPLPREHVDFEGGAYSLYNWELFFHVPLLIASRLSKNQKFREAQRFFHFIFNPFDSSSAAAPQRFWQFLPFKSLQPERILELLDELGYTGMDPALVKKKLDVENQIAEWAHDPFNPHLIARMRPGAYMKNVVMRYIDNLIAWGDNLFRQDTLEAINEATHLYVLCTAILGKRPQRIPAKNAETRQTFAQLRDSLDAFSNAHIAAETLFPFATSEPPTTAPPGSLSSATTTLFFCVPPNERLARYWDTIDDRLFKIRNCMNIEGVRRELPLFEPPIDPALLVQAAAKGVDLMSVLNDLYSPLPRYRFEHILGKALEMCADVRVFGASLLAALEKRDAEALAALRTTHERALLERLTEIKKRQVSEAQTAQAALERARDVASLRYAHYQQLLGYPGNADEALATGRVVSARGGENRLPEEVRQQQELNKANTWQIAAAGANMTANAIHLTVPDKSFGTSGGAATVSTSYGGSNIGAAATAFGSFFGALSADSSHHANSASIEAMFKRRDETWVLESNLAAKEMARIDKEIAAAAIRVAIAERELESHEKQIEEAKEVEEYLTSRKFTQQELYAWMQNELATLYFQCYQIAYEWAKQAQRCYRFALGVPDASFVQFGAWDSLRKGLLSGERLYLQLKQMERSYLERNARELELTKHVSLAMVDPVALIQLKQTGRCEVRLPEHAFDLDFPGHYMRRLRSVAITIPCVVGPYTGVNCTLTLLRHEIRTSPRVSEGYPRKDDSDDRFASDSVPTQSIATSQTQNDSGLFELNFRDERFLPFEGAGAVSTWRIELQNDFRSFDYDTIADVVWHLRYTARDGGELVRTAALRALKEKLKDEEAKPLVRMFSLRHEFPNAWHRFIKAPTPAGSTQTLTASLVNERFPFAFQQRKINIETMSLFVNVRSAYAATHNEATLEFSLQPGTTASDDPIALSRWHGLLHGELSPAGVPGDWTLTARRGAGGAATAQLDSDSIEDIVLVCSCTCA